MNEISHGVFKECILSAHKKKLAAEHNKSTETKYLTKTKDKINLGKHH
jgi:hypothetical protein